MPDRPNIAIRSATSDDLAELKAMLRESVEYLNAIDDPEPVSDEEIDRIERLAFGPDRKCLLLVADIDGAMAGHLAYFGACRWKAYRRRSSLAISMSATAIAEKASAEC